MMSGGFHRRNEWGSGYDHCAKVAGYLTIVIIALSILTATASAQSTYYVDECGNDAWSGASKACVGPDGAKRTIQNALLVAAPNDVIEVASGTYPGAVVIDKSGIGLHGCECGDSSCTLPVIQGGVTVFNADPLQEVTNVTIRGLDIQPESGNGILLEDSSNSHVLCNHVGRSTQGITISHSDWVEVAENEIAGWWPGATAPCADFNTALRLCDANNSTIVDNRVLNNTSIPFATCLSLDASSDAVVTGNTFTQCSELGIRGINSSDRVDLGGNDTSQSGIGVYIGTAANWRLKDHTSRQHAGTAVQALDVTELSVIGGSYEAGLLSFFIEGTLSTHDCRFTTEPSCQALECCLADSAQCIDGQCASVYVSDMEIGDGMLAVLGSSTVPTVNRVVIAGNRIRGDSFEAVRIDDAISGAVFGNVVEGTVRAFSFNETENLNVHGNTFLQSEVGIGLAASQNIAIFDNVFDSTQENMQCFDTFSCNNGWTDNIWNDYDGSQSSHPVCQPPCPAGTEDTNPKEGVARSIYTRPGEPELHQPYTVHMALTSNLPTTQEFGGLVQTSTQPSDVFWGLNVVPSLPVSRVGGGSIATDTTERYSFPFWNSWDWIRPHDGPLFTGLDVFGFIKVFGDFLGIIEGGLTIVDSGHRVDPLKVQTETIDGTQPAMDFGFDVDVKIPKLKRYYLTSAVWESVGGIVATFAGLYALTYPLGGQIVAAALFGVQSGLLIGANWNYEKALDPSLDFTQPVVVYELTPPEIAALHEGAAKKLALESFRLTALRQAELDGVARVYGALEAGQPFHAVDRLEEVVALTTQARSQALRLRRAWRALVNDTSFPDLSGADVALAKNEIAQNGLPALEVELLSRFGFTGTDIQNIEDGLLSLPMPCVGPTATGGIVVEEDNCSPGNSIKMDVAEQLFSYMAAAHSEQLGELAGIRDNDFNGDGVSDLADADGDGIPDVPDVDGDALPDMFELQYAGDATSMEPSGDPDGDGVTNQLEFDGATDPSTCDTDGDGKCDPGASGPSCSCGGSDNCPWDSNAGQLDTDGDGEGDACDTDDDDDGVADIEETAQGSIANMADTDGDTVDDALDNCVAEVNVGQEDCDGDGVGDVCDPFPGSESCSSAVPALSTWGMLLLILLLAIGGAQIMRFRP